MYPLTPAIKEANKIPIFASLIRAMSSKAKLPINKDIVNPTPPRNAIPKIIFNIGLVEHVDMIMMGSKGKSTLAATFLGGTTEKILLHNISIPILILKKKEINVGFLDALLKI